MAAQAVGHALAFARQLVGRVGRRTLRLRNAGPLPACWALAHREPLPAQFALSALGGLLAPAAEARVHVDFSAAVECCVAARLVLEVRAQKHYYFRGCAWVIIRAEETSVIYMNGLKRMRKPSYACRQCIIPSC